MSDPNDNAGDDIVALARQLFGEAGYQEALVLVDQYGTEPHERDVNRVKRAILELSDGKRTRLPYFVQCAKIDYRDVLMPQRLGPMSDEEEIRWQANADRLLALWNAKK
jgi:hypothetical protein